jgi:hypothetical protein
MRSTLTAIVMMLLVATPLAAQEIACTDVKYDAEIMANYPEVHEACLDVVEDQGVRYVHLRARVLNNWISSMTIRYEHSDGTWGYLKTVTPPEGFTAIVNGVPTPVEEIQEGTVMNIFVPEGRWEVAMADVDMPAMADLTFAPVEVSEADEPADAVEAEEVPAENQMVDAEGPYAGISPIVWILLAVAFVVFLWIYRIKRQERE